MGGIGWAPDEFDFNGNGTIDPGEEDTDGDNDELEQVIRAAPFNRRFVISEQTRGVVWGAERPELLMTEGLALHDRRLIDETLTDAVGVDPGAVNGEPADMGNFAGGDDDPDQILRPRGSAFVELYNPWSADDQKPRELYSRQQTFLTRPGPGTPFTLDPDVDVIIPANEIRPNIPYRSDSSTPYEPVEGIALDRLSNGAAVRRDPSRSDEERSVASPNGKRYRIDNDGFRFPPVSSNIPGFGNTTPGFLLPPAASPVWRVICVEEHPDVRNQVTEASANAADDNPFADPPNSDSPVGLLARPVRPDADQ